MEFIKLITFKEWIQVLLLTAIISIIVIGGPKLIVCKSSQIKRRKIESDESLSIEQKQIKLEELEIKETKNKKTAVNIVGCVSVSGLTCFIGAMFFGLVVMILIVSGAGLAWIFNANR